MVRFRSIIFSVIILCVSGASGSGWCASNTTKTFFDGIKEGDYNLVFSLVSDGIDLNDLDFEGLTPLHAAVSYGDIPLVKFFLEHGADVNAKTDFNETPLHLVSLIEDDQKALEITKLLIGYSAEIDAPESIYHSTALFWQNKEVVDLLLNNGADIEYTTPEGYTPLLWHINSDANDVVRLLINRGANVNQKLTDQKSALHLACFLENTEIVKLLIENGVDINAVDQNGWTPLHIAALENNEEIVALLIENGANKKMKTSADVDPFKRKSLPIDIARISHASKQIVRYLKN